MENDWQIKRITDIAAKEPNSIAMGPFGSNIKTENFVSSGVPVIRGVNLNSDRFNDSGFVYLTEEKADKLYASNAFPGDLVFTHRGTLGQVGIIPLRARYDRYVVSQSQMKLRCDKNKVEPLFLFYFFRSPQGQYELLSNTSTTGVPAISRPLTTLKSIKILLPPILEQRAIAHVLGSLDDKIELNRKMNQTLEAMARAIFKSWFVDFDPVRAKAEGRETGLPDEIAKLFPDGIEQTEMGEVPRGWKVGTLSDVANVTSGKRPQERSKEKKDDFKIPLYGGGGIMGYVKETMISEPFLLTGRVGTLGKIFLIREECWPSDNTLLIFPQNKQFLEYLFFILLQIDFNSLNRGSTQPLVTQTDLKNQKILIPNKIILAIFWQNVSLMFKKIDYNRIESDALSLIRETLLPKLISGELRVPDAEKLVEEIA